MDSPPRPLFHISFYSYSTENPGFTLQERGSGITYLCWTRVTSGHPGGKILGFGSGRSVGIQAAELEVELSHLSIPGFSPSSQHSRFNLEALMLATGLAAILPQSKARDKSIQHHLVAWEGQFFHPGEGP